MHKNLLEQIRAILMAAPPTAQLEVTQIGEVDDVADNSSELELEGMDGRVYVLSLIDKED